MTALPDAWHATTTAEVLQHLDARPQGLGADEAAGRLAQHGPNRLLEAERPGPLRRFLRQFHNILIYVLIASGIGAFALGETVDAAVIGAVVLLNALIGFLQEGRAERALDAIRNMIAPSATVLRAGRRTTVRSEALVPGDIVVLEAGDRVSADLRLLRARALSIEEAALTGESTPVDKQTEPVEAAASLADRSCMAYSGTLVTRGQGQGVVVATGARTEIGRIGALVQSVQSLETPLIRQMDRFARQLSVVITAVGAGVFGFAVALRDYAPADAFMAVVALVVAAIPEGLPAVMTIALAIGVQRMVARHAIIRRLPAVETLGAVTVICSDKTGTLTRNEMTVRSVVTADARYEVSGTGYAPHGGFAVGGIEVDTETQPALLETVRAGLLCSDASLHGSGDTWTVVGDPMEAALVSLAMKAGEDPAQRRAATPRTDEIPFDAQHRFMATLHHTHENGTLAYVKGAPERLLAMCSAQRAGAGTAPIDRARWSAGIDALAGQGQRVLAIGTRPVPTGTRELRFGDVESGLVLLGLFGLIDPPREEAIEAVAACRSAGIDVKMITGDHGRTAGAIAAQLQLRNPAEVVSGQEIDVLDDAALAARVARASVFARTTPEHKLRLVTALQAQGHVVAMTGDGVNDAPALKRADVGVAMGHKGTEAAKESAEMVLADDNFASIVAAVREGRTVYDNLTKVIAWTLPTNGGEGITIMLAILLGLTLPVTPLQILWINMITSVGLGLALAFEPTEPDAMRRPPRPRDAALLGPMLVWRIVLVSVLFAGAAFGIFEWALTQGLAPEAGRTMVVNTIVVLEVFYLFSVRYVHGRSLTLRGVVGTPAVLIGVGSIVAAQGLLTYAPPLQAVFQTRPLTLGQGLIVIVIGFAALLLIEIEKALFRRLRPSASAG